MHCRFGEGWVAGGCARDSVASVKFNQVVDGRSVKCNQDLGRMHVSICGENVSTRAALPRWGDRTHGVADRLEEEEREEAAHTCRAGGEGDAEGEDTAPDAVQREQQRGVDEVEDEHADEAGWSNQ